MVNTSSEKGPANSSVVVVGNVQLGYSILLQKVFVLKGDIYFGKEITLI